MVKKHLKRIAAPKTWRVARKETKYIMRQSPGPHTMQYSLPLSLAIREMIKFAKSAKDAKQIINLKDVFVDKRKRTEEKHPVGLMDIIEFPQIEDRYRILLDSKGKLCVAKANEKEAATKLLRIEAKTKLKGGKTQLNLFDGRNITVDKDGYKVGDTVQISLPEQKITEHFKLDKNATVLLIGGKHAGTIAKIEEINQDNIIIRTSKNQKADTKKKHAFVIGADKPALDSIKQLSMPK
jgi:small subunit ribosomal protein S4e